MENQQMAMCALCGRTENEVPLTSWRYQGEQLDLCPACMPAFIHETEKALAQWQARRSQTKET